MQGGFSLTATVLPELGLSVRRAAAGRLLLLVETPGVGKLTAQADGTIVTKAGKRTRKRKVVLAKVSAATNAEGTTTSLARCGQVRQGSCECGEAGGSGSSLTSGRRHQAKRCRPKRAPPRGAQPFRGGQSKNKGKKGQTR